MRQIELIHKDKIKPYENNPRNNTQAVSKVAESIKEFGFTNPLILDKDYNIIAGHTRFKAGQTLGIIEYPCIVINDLSETQAQALRLIDNRTAEYAEWDTTKLQAEIKEILETDFNADLLDFADILQDSELIYTQENNEVDLQDREIARARKSLKELFLIPPFSILDTRKAEWQQRRKQWRKITQDSGDTRQETLFNNGLLTQGGLSNVSLIDEVLCEIIVTWFGKKGGLVFDTFAGSRFGIVATELGMEFKGIELRKEQAELNQARAEALNLNATYYNDTALNIDKYIDNDSADLFYTCPPYFNLEKYSNNPNDLSNMSLNDFYNTYEAIIKKAYAKLKNNRFAVIVIGEVRDTKSRSGEFINLVGKTIEIAQNAGFKYYNEIVLINALSSLPLRTANKFTATRKIGKHHQNILIFTKGEILEIHNKILVFLKGDAREATKATDLCNRDFEIEKIEYEQADIDSL